MFTQPPLAVLATNFVHHPGFAVKVTGRLGPMQVEVHLPRAARGLVSNTDQIHRPREDRTRMTDGELKSMPCFGFLTVCEHPPHGLFGGYLILNQHGRPLEFHCTAPVKPNRAQEILYGPTLKPYLYGEQIGQTLISRARIVPQVVFTDVEPAMSADDFVESRVVWVVSADPPPETAERYDWLPLQSHRLAIPRGRRQRLDEVRDAVDRFLSYTDLLEPFGRIREALDEARSPNRAA